MSKLDFEVDRKLFKERSTNGLKLVYSKLLSNNFFQLVFYNKKADGSEEEIKEEIINNRITRIFVEQEIIDTLIMVIEHNDEILAASIKNAQENICDLKNRKDISGLIAWGGTLSIIPMVIGFKKFRNGDTDALKYAIPALIGLIASIIVFKKHSDQILAYREAKEKLNEDIKEEGMKLVRKSKT